MEFVRSEPARLRNGSIINPRRHENVLTSFIDASMVYGSDLPKVLQLRDNGGKEALLKTSFYRGKERLPQGKPDVCINDGPDHYCALAGRSSEPGEGGSVGGRMEVEVYGDKVVGRDREKKKVSNHPLSRGIFDIHRHGRQSL